MSFAAADASAANCVLLPKGLPAMHQNQPDFDKPW